jgi:AraC-like DNA-binding protein
MPELPTNLWPVPVHMLAEIANELNKQGVTAQQLLVGTGISEQVLLQPEKLLPYRTAQKIVERACELSPAPDLGLVVGAGQTPSSMGILGYGINCCATVEDAMNMAVKYYRVSSTLLESEWRQENGNLHWIAKPPIELKTILRFLVEQEFSMLCRLFPMLTGQSARLHEAHFSYPEPEDVSLYRKLFDCTLVFSADENHLVMSASQLKLPILQANALNVAAAESMCGEFLAANPITDDLIMRVRKLILEQKNNFWTEAVIAEKMNVTSRTLRNRLRRLGTSYQEILDSLREQIARHVLRRSRLTVSEIAEHVGYSDARSFRRAFKKWTGMTPDQYRNSATVGISNPDV